MGETPVDTGVFDKPAVNIPKQIPLLEAVVFNSAKI
jgi:hypothetical protein